MVQGVKEDLGTTVSGIMGLKMDVKEVPLDRQKIVPGVLRK